MALFSVRLIFKLLLFSLTSLTAFAQDYPGAIPLLNIRPPASDLVFNGEQLLPEQAEALVLQRAIPDLSHLDPRTDTDLWKPEFHDTNLDYLDDLGLKTAKEDFEFVPLMSHTPSIVLDF